jgi:hypothetical protein
MAVAPKKTDLISVGELPRVVANAVKAAQVRVGAIPDGPFIKRWEIYGRYVRDLDLGRKFATEVSAEIGKAGTAVNPAVLILGRDILCGFVEKGNLPQQRNF